VLWLFCCTWGFCFVLICFVVSCFVSTSFVYTPLLARQCVFCVVCIPFLFRFTQQYFPAVSWTAMFFSNVFQQCFSAMFFSSVFHPPTRQCMYLYITPPLQEYRGEILVSFAGVWDSLATMVRVSVFHPPTHQYVYLYIAPPLQEYRGERQVSFARTQVSFAGI